MNSIRHTCRKAMLVLALSLGSIEACPQVSFRTPELEQVARSLCLPVDSLHEGHNYLSADGLPVTVTMQGDSLVTHVGRTLFNEEMKQAHSRSILEFVERYSLLLRCPTAGRTPSAMMQSDDVHIERGRLSDFDHIRPEVSSSSSMALISSPPSSHCSTTSRGVGTLQSQPPTASLRSTCSSQSPTVGTSSGAGASI